MARYVSKPVPVQAIQLTDISIQYEKWGGVQVGKRGDWLLSKGGEVYTCDHGVFAETYRPIDGRPGWFVKVAYVDAVQMFADGKVKTLEGESAYLALDYLVTNPGGDQYVIPRSKFEGLYDPV